MVALMIVTISYAQNMLVATLTHGDEITMYYGNGALYQAHNAAQSGDVINLSGGSFASVKITKGITLRGTGIDDVSPTYLSGDFSIEVPSTETNRLTMEGIRCPGKITMSGDCSNPYFVKCRFTNLYSDSFSMKNATFVNCIIIKCELKGSGTLQFINSDVTLGQLYPYGALFKNCLIESSGSGMYNKDISKSQIYNSIIYQTKYTSDTDNSGSSNNERNFPSSTSCHNCVIIGYKYAIYRSDSGSSGNYGVHHDDTNAFTKVFKGYEDGGSTLFYNYELTDEAKKKYLGDDGTEVGIYGGVLPYSSIPSYPRITKMNVANKTTADGKLSVEIEVSAAE